MIDTTVLFIAISLMFMLTLLLIGTIHSRLHWAAKAFFIVFSLAVVTMDYKVLTDSLGWPVKDALPNSFRLLGTVIEEPSISSNREGAIYVWYVTYDADGKPRNVQIPYSKDMHKAMSKAQSMLAKGQQVHMSRFKQGEGSLGRGKPGQSDQQGEGRQGQSTYQIPGPLDFVPPPDAVPMKDEQ